MADEVISTRRQVSPLDVPGLRQPFAKLQHLFYFHVLEIAFPPDVPFGADVGLAPLDYTALIMVEVKDPPLRLALPPARS